MDNRDFSVLSTHRLFRSCPDLPPGDFINDCKADLEDLTQIAELRLLTPADTCWNTACDLEADGMIDFRDFAVFGENRGR